MSNYPQRGRDGYGRPPPGYYDRRSAYPPRDYQRPEQPYNEEQKNDTMEVDSRNENMELENGEIVSPVGGNSRGEYRDYPERRYPPPPDRYGEYNRYDDGYRGRVFRGRGMSRGYPNRGYTDGYNDRRRYPPPPAYNSSARGYPDRYPHSPERYRHPPSPNRYGMRRTPSPFSRGSRSPSPMLEKRTMSTSGFSEERRSSIQSSGLHPARSPSKADIPERRQPSPEYGERSGSPDYHAYEDRRPRSPEFRSRPLPPYPDRRPFPDRYNRPISVYNERGPYERRPPSPGMDRRPPSFRRPPSLYDHYDRPPKVVSPEYKPDEAVTPHEDPSSEGFEKRQIETQDDQIEKSFDSMERSYSQSTGEYKDSPRANRPIYPGRPPYQRRGFNEYAPSRHQSYPQSDRYGSSRYPPSNMPPANDRYPPNDRFPPADRYPPNDRFPADRYPAPERFPPSHDRPPQRDPQVPRDPYYSRPPPKSDFPPAFVDAAPKSPKEAPKEKAQLILTPTQIELNRLLQDEQKHRGELERIYFDMYRATRDVDKFDGILDHIAQELQSF
ncbi:hypothetical protein HDV06_000562 [Boothiomyces sp. JEL0866]|nr:hypothetical protein HDV06_000562 [Boothiomyces sp. JEL0866]